MRRRFWFGGDTGMAPVFKEIGERLGPFDLAAIPIGACERWGGWSSRIGMDPSCVPFAHAAKPTCCHVSRLTSPAPHPTPAPHADEPRWFMGPQHINPAEAVQIHRDVQAQQSVACHLATFW